MVNRNRLINKFIEYVKIDSPAREELRFARTLVDELEELGFDVVMDKAGENVNGDSGNIYARLKGQTKAEPILFTSHMDTVSPGRGINPIIKDNVIYSDGTTILGSDDKAGIVAILEAIKSLSENGISHGDIEVVFTIFEEGGLFGIKNFNTNLIESRNIFVLDAGGKPGGINIKAPAKNKINVKFIGKTAHAGIEPEKGISAISMAAKAIDNMKLLRIDNETTANIGFINGGSGINVVAEEVEISLEVRSLNNDKLYKETENILKICRDAAKFFNGRVEIEVEELYKAFSIDENDAIIKLVAKANQNLNLRTRLISSGGGSDTNIWIEKGFNAINLSMGSECAHTLEEHIDIKDLEDSARLVMEIIRISN